LSGISTLSKTYSDAIYYKTSNTVNNNSTANHTEFDVSLSFGNWHLTYFLMFQLATSAAADNVYLSAYNDAVDYSSRIMALAHSIHYLTPSAETPFQLCKLECFFKDVEYDIGSSLTWHAETAQAYNMTLKAGSWLHCKKLSSIQSI
jgi:hypothetical protein